MNYSLLILPFAKIDIKETAIWYNEQQENLGKKFLKTLKKKLPPLNRIPNYMK